MNKMTIGNLLTHEESGMPLLEVLITEEEEGKGEFTLYLSPFRLYGFQVSGTRDGSGDYGSSPVFGLGNVIDAVDGLQRRKDLSTRSNLDQEEFLIEMLRGQISLALMGAVRYFGVGVIPNITGWGEPQEKVTEFIKECIEYTRNNR